MNETDAVNKLKNIAMDDDPLTSPNFRCLCIISVAIHEKLERLNHRVEAQFKAAAMEATTTPPKDWKAWLFKFGIEHPTVIILSVFVYVWGVGVGAWPAIAFPVK